MHIWVPAIIPFPKLLKAAKRCLADNLTIKIMITRIIQPNLLFLEKMREEIYLFVLMKYRGGIAIEFLPQIFLPKPHKRRQVNEIKRENKENIIYTHIIYTYIHTTAELSVN